MSKGLRPLGILLVAGLSSTTARADAPLVHDMSQRRAIRGCDADGPCDAAPKTVFLEFEEENFSRPGQRPWVDLGTATVATNRAAKSVDGLPDWLQGLKMPDLPVRWHGRLVRYLEFYKENPRGRDIMKSWLRRQGRYRRLIEAELARAGLPQDLVYVSMIESSYYPLTHSYAGARGLWQFMPAGGAIYGLRQDFWVDERSDPVLATRAVVDYWRDLYQRFGDWHLVLAGFNAGYGAVIRSIAKYNTNDFWQLIGYENGLPWECSNYVPKALATAIVGNNLRRFGYEDVQRDPAITYEEVQVPAGTPLSLVAEASGVPSEEVQGLNPHLLRARTPPGSSTSTVRIPRGKRAAFAASFRALRSKQPRLATYTLRRGQRFEDVATMHGTTSYRLRRMNGARTESELKAGTLVFVPVVSLAERKKNAERARNDLYRSGVPRGRDGEKLVVALPDPDRTVSGKKRVFYRVVSGDTLSGIGKGFGVSFRKLATWNGLNPNARLHPRMILQAFVDRDFDAKRAGVQLLDPARLTLVKTGSRAHLDTAESREGRKRILYHARRTESYADIAKRFGLTARDLSRINRRPHTTVLQKGETAIVYKVVDRTRGTRAAGQAGKLRRPRRDRRN